MDHGRNRTTVMMMIVVHIERGNKLMIPESD